MQFLCHINLSMKKELKLDWFWQMILFFQMFSFMLEWSLMQKERQAHKKFSYVSVCHKDFISPEINRLEIGEANVF